MTTPEEQRVIDAAKAWKEWCVPSTCLHQISVLGELYEAVEALPDEDVELVAKAITKLCGATPEVWQNEAKAVVKALRDAGRLK